MRFDSSTFYSIIGVVPFRKKDNFPSVLSSLSSFSNTSKVTIKGMIDPTQQSFDKKISPTWSQAELLVWAKPLPAPFLPVSKGWGSSLLGAAWKTKHPKRKKKNPTKMLGQLRWRGLTADGFARGGGNNTACQKVQRKDKDAALGCCPTDPIILLPWQGETSPSRVRRKMWPGSIHWGDLDKFLEISMMWNSIFHWEHFWELGGEKEAGKKNQQNNNPKHGKKKLLAKVVMFYRTLSCWFHLSSVNPAEEWSIPQTAASEPQLYIYNYNYSNISIYLYLYKYTLKSVTALAPNTEEKYWRCCWMRVVALTEVLWRWAPQGKAPRGFESWKVAALT